MIRSHRGRLGILWGRCRHYFNETIWRPLPAGTDRQGRLLRRGARCLYLLVRGFRDDRILVRAPSLTLFTLLGLVPLLAMAVTASKAFGLQQRALDYVGSLLTNYLAAGQQPVVDVVIGYVESTRLGTLGGVGVLFLLYTAVGMLGRIERSFNDIWGVSVRRPLHRRVTDYLSVLVIFPALLLVSTGITASWQSAELLARLRSTPVISGALAFGGKLLPVLIVSAGFTFLYKYMPYTRVRLRAAIAAGFVAGVIWHLAQWAFIELQVGVTNHNVIYGTFAALPIFLIWLNASWIIVLIGCEVAYAVQHESTYHPPLPRGLVSIAQRERAALQIVAQVWAAFGAGRSPGSVGDLAAEIDLPRPVTMEIAESLINCGLLARTETPEGAVLPARNLDNLSIGELLVAYRHAGKTSHGDLEGLLDRQVRAVHDRLEAALQVEGRDNIETVLSPAKS